MAKGNAGDWTEGDAQAQEAELAGIRDPSLAARVEVHRTYTDDRTEAEKLLRLAAQACKNQGGGKTAEIKKQGKGWAVVITKPKKK